MRSRTQSRSAGAAKQADGRAGWPDRVRARLPESDGYIERDGVRVFYEVFGSGEPTFLMLPTWSVLHAAHGRFQIADLARDQRVVTFDGRGNGRSDRPRGREAYGSDQFVADAVAVLDATSTDRAIVIGCSTATLWVLRLAAEYPDRVLGCVASGTNLPLAPAHALATGYVPFHDHYGSTEGWAKFNADYWRDHYEDFLRFFFSQVWTEPHSHKVIDDAVTWGLETTAETLIDTVGASPITESETIDLARGVRCPMLVIHGENDAVTPWQRSARLAQETNGKLAIIPGAGHCSGNRNPVTFDLLVREFADEISPRPRRGRRTRANGRNKRVLCVPSCGGLGTMRRDIAIADSLRDRRPDVEVHWLASSPVRETLEGRGESIHPASDALASEAGYLEQQAGAYELHRFNAWRDAGEFHFVNFMVFHDVTRDERYDLVVADGAWQVDHFLHEHPELKRFAYAWLTDTIGWLPVRSDGERETRQIAAANAEMLDHVEGGPRIRDCALYVGDLADVPRRRLGRGLPSLPEWAKLHFSFTGPMFGFHPAEVADRDALRRELGYGPDELVCLVTVGGAAVGEALIRRAVDALPIARLRRPALRMVVAAGPRVDPVSVPACAGVEVHGYVGDLHRHLAACDVAVVHGGLATTTELLVARRPFIWFPLGEDVEQRVHVAHRLARRRAGVCMDYGTTSPEALADAILGGLGGEIRYRPIERDGVGGAASTLASLL